MPQFFLLPFPTNKFLALLKEFCTITKTMYPTIATMHKTTAFRVERAMRHAIDVSYNKGKIPCLNQIFSLDIFSPYDKPTNAEFIALIADKLKQEFCC